MVKFKNFLALILCTAMCFGISTETHAVENSEKVSNGNEEQIADLFEEMAECIVSSLLTDGQSDECQRTIADIEEQLSALGVHEMGEEEISDFFSLNNVASPRVSQPADTNTVKWYMSERKNYTYNSEAYDIQLLTAIGNNPGGMLVTGADNAEFYSNENKVVGSVVSLVSIYLQKGIGTIPLKIVQWSPYELLFSNTSTNVVNSSYVTHRCVSAITFAYVKKSSQSDSNYTLSHFSNQISVAINAHGAAVVDSVPKTYSKEETFTNRSDTYCNIEAAIKAYNGTSARYDYIESYTMYSYDEQYSIIAEVPNPLVGAGQIY